MTKTSATIRFEKGADEERCVRLLKKHGDVLMSAADVNKDRPGGQHKAYVPLPEERLILMCCGRQQAAKEGLTLDRGIPYLMVAYSWDGPIGRYIRHHMNTDPDAISIPSDEVWE